MSAQEQILIIKHGALGDIILATGPMAAIRRHHPSAHITLLTTPPYSKLLEASPFVDEVWTDIRPKAWMIRRLARLKRQLNSRPFARVYDLQTSERSSRYLKLFTHQPEWSGIAKGASHRHNSPERTSLHTIERQKQQLAIAEVQDVPGSNIDWMTADVSGLRPDDDYVILVPGGSAHRPEKRWPVERYTELAARLVSQGISPVLIGANAEVELLNQIEAAVSAVKNLCNRTSFEQLATLARHACYAVGNDTGPMHIVAAAGCPSTVLFSYTSNPDLCAPRGKHVTILREPDLATLTSEAVENSLKLAATT